jgi:hypothetical protein
MPDAFVRHDLEFVLDLSGDKWRCSCGFSTKHHTRLGVLDHQARMRLGEEDPARRHLPGEALAESLGLSVEEILGATQRIRERYNGTNQTYIWTPTATWIPTATNYEIFAQEFRARRGGIRYGQNPA